MPPQIAACGAPRKRTVMIDAERAVETTRSQALAGAVYHAHGTPAPSRTRRSAREPHMDLGGFPTGQRRQTFFRGTGLRLISAPSRLPSSSPRLGLARATVLPPAR